MKANILLSALVVASLSTGSFADTTGRTTDKTTREMHSGTSSSALDQRTGRSAASLPTDDSPSDRGRNPEGNGDEIFQPNNDGTTDMEDNRTPRNDSGGDELPE